MTRSRDLPFKPPVVAPDVEAQDQDFVFRFRLEDLGPDEVVYDDPLLELIRGELADLLDAVVLTHGGERVMVDGFRLMQEPDTNHEIFPQPEPNQP